MNLIVTKSDINLVDLMSLDTANAEVTAEDSDGNTVVVCDTSTSSCSVKFGGVTVSHSKNIKHED